MSARSDSLFHVEFYNVFQPSGSVSRKEQLELSSGFDQTTEM
jgi:hypothetical protein